MASFVDIETSVAVLTGAGSGIGRATAISLARRGARVVVSDIDAERAESVASEVRESGAAAQAIRCDVTRQEDFEALRDCAVDRFGQVDIVMNNVGVLAV